MLSGATLRIVTPDASLIYSAYKDGNINFFKAYKSWFQVRKEITPSLEDYLVQLLATPKSRVYTAYDNKENKLSSKEIRFQFETLSEIDFLNWLIEGLDKNNDSGTDHLNWFNHQKLKEISDATGFKYIPSAFGQSSFLPFKQVPLFDETMPSISMYADLIKM